MLKANALDVSKTTTLRDLQAFSGDLKREGENLRARTVDGHIQLYSTPAKAGLAGALNKLNPSAMHGRWLAQKALKTIFANHERASGAPASEVLTENVRKPLTGNLKMGVLHVTSTIAAVKADQDDNKTFGAKDGPDIRTLGLDSVEVKDLVAEAAIKIGEKNIGAIKNFDEAKTAIAEVGVELRELKQKLGDLLHANFEKTHPTDEQRRDFALSTGDAAVKHLMKELASHLFPDARDMDELKTSPKGFVLHDVALAAYDRAAAKSSSDQFINENEFRLDGVTYKADPDAAPLGKGGFGTVRAFKAEDGTEIEVAVKIPNKTDALPSDREKSTREGISEHALHGLVEGSGHPNVVAMKGVLRMPNGGVAVVLELAKHGDLKGFSKDLRSAAQSGAVSPEDALLAQRVATRDMLQGIQHCHANGMTNQDVKPDNFLIGEGGVIKLADNGGARPKAGILDDAGSHTERFLSPEISNRKERNVVINQVFGEKSGSAPQPERSPTDMAIRHLIDRQFPKASEDDKDALVSQYKSAAKQQVLEDLTAKRDGYALGLAADGMTYQKAYSGPTGPAVERASHERPASGMRGRADALRSITQEGARLRSLVSDLGDPKFERRTTPAQALKDGALALTADEIRRGREVIVSVAEWGKATRGGVLPPAPETSAPS